MKGEECRKIFYNDKTLDLMEGYKILMGGVSGFCHIQCSLFENIFMCCILIVHV